MTNKDKLIESAQKFLAKGHLPKAIGEYQKLVEAFPKDYRNRQKLAELLSREKRNDEAQPHYEAVAKNFTETGFYLKAIAIYKQMQKIDPSQVDLYLRLAELNEKQGLTGNALNEYRNLVALYDQNRMGRETVGVLQRMIVLEPENLGLRGKLIETLEAIGEDQEALEQFRTLVRWLVGKDEQAKIIKLYEKFIDLCPDDVDSRLPLATALLASGQAEKSLVLLKGLLKQAPDHAILLSVLTDCHMALGNYGDARLTCQHLLKEQPHNLDLCERYIRICIAGSECERALDSLEESRELFSAGDRVETLKGLYETLQASLPDDPRLQATLAAICEATGDAGSRPVFATGKQVAGAAGETADAASLDAAIGDVEQLDMVGEAVSSLTGVPPRNATAVPALPAKTKGRQELELDLDLDLELPAMVAVPAVPVAEPKPLSVPVVSEPPAAELEMELEFDLDGLDGLVAQPPPIESAVTEAFFEVASALEPEPVGEEVAESESSAVALAAEASGEAFTLPDFGALEFEVEPVAAEVAAVAAEALFEPAGEESARVEELEDVEELEAVEGLDETGSVPVLPDGGPLEVFEELEELEDLEEILEGDEAEPEDAAGLSAQQRRDELEDAEFYLRQGLFDEADRVALGLQERSGAFPELTAKLAEIAVQRQAAESEGAGVPFDLMADIKDEELLGATDFLGEAPGSDGIDEFALHTSAEEDDEDVQSHFDLGIAYKEMGLLDDAIAEFGKAARDPSRLLDCLTLKGQCQAEMGETDKAEVTFREVLGLSILTDDLRVALRYELGLLYESSGRAVEALECFQIVADQDLFFREVTDKLKALRHTLGLDDDLVEPETPKSSRDRISFV